MNLRCRNSKLGYASTAGWRQSLTR